MAFDPAMRSTGQASPSMAHSITSLFSAKSDELDATELQPYSSRTGRTQQAHHHDDDGSQSGQATPTHADGDTSTGLTIPDQRSSSEAEEPYSAAPSLRDAPSCFSNFWRNNISVVVPVKDARDHLALERTYLSYHRTSLVLAMLATIVAQLTVINHAPSPSPSFGFHALGKPLAAVLATCAVISSIVGGLRWWRLQEGMLRGVAISGGREVVIVGSLIGIIIASTFGLILAIDIDKEYVRARL